MSTQSPVQMLAMYFFANNIYVDTFSLGSDFYFCIATRLCGLATKKKKKKHFLGHEHNTRYPDVSSKKPHKQGWKVSQGVLENVQWCHM